MKKNIKLISLMITIAMVVSLMVGCTQDGTSSAGSEGAAGEGGGSGRSSGTLTVAMEDDIESLSPFEICTGLSGKAIDIMYEKLFIMNPDGKVAPVLVEEYGRESDLVWTFKLKEGVLFHDGTELTAEDVKASLENAGTYPVPKVHEKVVEVTDKYNFTITTPYPDATLIEDDLVIGWNSIVPKALLDAGNNFMENPIGTGPYKFTERATAEYLRFDSFESYRSDPERDGRIPTIIFKIIPEPSSRTIALENGEVDLIISVESMDISRLVDNPNTEVLETPGTGMYNLTLNMRRPGLDNLNVRKAIAYAINPESSLSVAANGNGFICRGLTKPGAIGYSEVGQPTYDVEKAKQFLADSGYAPGELSFEILAFKTQFSRAAEAIQADLAEIGINITIANVESAVMIEKTAAGDFDAMYIANSAAGRSIKTLQLMFHTNTITAGNRAFFSDPRVDEIINALPATLDPEEQAKLTKEAMEICQDSCGVIPIFIDNMYTAYSTKLTNVYRGIHAAEVYLWLIRFK